MIFRALLSILFVASLALPVRAQMTGGAPAGPVVKAIAVDYVGPEAISRERVLANLKTKVGDPYSERLAEEDVKTLFATGDVANVRIFAQPCC